MRGIPVDNLLIEDFEDAGQAHHTISEYLDIAIEVAQSENLPLAIAVEWRPQNVDPPWRNWKHAHFQIEVTWGGPKLPLEFRRKLAANARCKIPPKMFREVGKKYGCLCGEPINY